MDRLFDMPEVVVDSPQSQLLVGSSAQGKVSEMLAMAKLLDMGHRIAVPVVDDDGVDFVVNYRTAVQVKSTNCLSWPRRHTQGHYRFQFDLRSSGMSGEGKPRSTASRLRPIAADVFVFHARPTDQWWVVPNWALREAAVTGRVAFRPSGGAKSSQGQLLHGWLEAWHVFEEEMEDARA